MRWLLGPAALCQTADVPEATRPVLVLDSASLYYRSFHALPESMTAPDGRPHNAVRGFLSTVTRLVDAYSPTAVIAAWDYDWRPQWRVDLVPSYKAHRVAGDGAEAGGAVAEAEPESLGDQAAAIAGIVEAAGIARIGFDGYEADDVIGSVAAQSGRRVIAVSGDRDLVQVVSPTASLLLTVNGGMDKWPLLDEQGVVERFGVRPERYVDVAVLRGDPSDGLPGVTGIGAKTAVSLVNAFGGLDDILAAAAAAPDSRPMTPRLAAALVAHRDAVYRARTVAQVVTDLPVAPGLAGSSSPDRLSTLAQEWGVTRQVDELVAALARQAA